MLLAKSNFYTIKHFDALAAALEAIITINPDHVIFEGHFPGQAVVPGVCMLQIIKEMAELALEQKLRLSKASQIKYLQVWQPEKDVEALLIINWKDAGQFQASISIKEQVIMKMSGCFETNE